MFYLYKETSRKLHLLGVFENLDEAKAEAWGKAKEYSTKYDGDTPKVANESYFAVRVWCGMKFYCDFAVYSREITPCWI